MRFSSKSRVGTILALCFVFLVSLSRILHAQQPSSNLVLYDTFDETFLSPTKWSPFGICFTGNVLECVREIQDDKLRLAVRSYGATNSNQGNGYGPSEVHFTNPTPIRSIAAQFAIIRASAVGCPTSTDGSHTEVLIDARFFNSGSGNAVDDVEAILSIPHYFNDPAGVSEVVLFTHWQGQYFGFLSLTPVNVGQKVVAQLSWDQPGHQFIASSTDVVTGTVSKVFLPYTMSDTTPPAFADKFIGVRTFPSNCVGTQTSVDLDASFDKVWIGN